MSDCPKTPILIKQQKNQERLSIEFRRYKKSWSVKTKKKEKERKVRENWTENEGKEREEKNMKVKREKEIMKEKETGGSKEVQLGVR